MIIKQHDQEFVNHPEQLAQGVCVDIVEMGLCETKFGKKERVKLVFESSVLMETGKPFLVSNLYNCTMAPKSSLRAALEAWRGAKFSDDDLKEGFDMENLLHKNCQMQIVHTPGEGDNVWANINALLPLSQGMEPLKPSGGYVRVKDRPKEGAGQENDIPKF